MSMQGRGISNSSRICTVFSSKVLAPPSQPRTMFCAIWVCGPAAGPIGGGAGRRPPLTNKTEAGATRGGRSGGRGPRGRAGWLSPPFGGDASVRGGEADHDGGGGPPPPAPEGRGWERATTREH